MMQHEWYDSGLVLLFHLPRGLVCFRFHLTLLIATTCTLTPDFYFKGSASNLYLRFVLLHFLCPNPHENLVCCLKVNEDLAERRFSFREKTGDLLQNIQGTRVIKCRMSMLFSRLKQKGWHAYSSCAISWCGLHLFLLFLISLPINGMR